MGRDVKHLVRTWPDTPETRDWLTTPREDIVLETSTGPTADEIAVFEQETGPFVAYRRTVAKSSHGTELVETLDYKLVIPWFSWLFGRLIGRLLRRRDVGPEPSKQPAWAPPDRLTARQAPVLGLLAAASLLSAFVNTLFTQTVAFAGDDFGVGDWAVVWPALWCASESFWVCPQHYSPIASVDGAS